MNPQNELTKYKSLLFETTQCRENLKTFLRSVDIPKKSEFLGWGVNNFENRLKQNISDQALIEAVEKVLRINNGENNQIQFGNIPAKRIGR